MKNPFDEDMGARALYVQCFQECALHFPATTLIILERMADRLVASLTHEPKKRRMSKTEFNRRCHELLESLEGINK